ncbi:Aldo/keto reductase [Saccharata proteae CBS 121410]|uniref:Aldo/keto reductase n=1 Tax=Saccharata proteae CBS 121410 TaxID=1314787 RepID=A0A9P4LUN8_9PEZI|nr:Aldo/keto reductase [Saccharata proteae CBS 121410]
MAPYAYLTTAFLAITPFVPASGGVPTLLGFGTWNLKVSPENTTGAVSLAIQHGYRHIDCAAIYGNEPAVGKGIADGLERTGLKREDLWITSKLWNDHHGGGKEAEEGLNKTLEDLGVGYLDLYLMHWPVGGKSNELDYIPTWHGMEKLLKTNKVKNIGVSNFSPHQLKALIKSSTVKPAVHQMELHPYLQQTEWVEFHHEHGIHVTAYSPLGNSNPTYHGSSRGANTRKTPPLLLENEALGRIAQARNCTPAQVALAWGMQRGTSVIPKSSHETWIVENRDSLQCGLVEPDLDKIEELGEKYLTRFNNPSASWGVELFEGLDDA